MLPAVLEWNATVLGEKSRAISDAMGQGSQDAHVVVKTLISELACPPACGSSTFPDICYSRLPSAPTLIP